MTEHTDAPIRFAYWVPNVSGGLVISKIPQRTGSPLRDFGPRDLDDQGRAWYAIADRDAPGLTVIDDWSSFGQRTTSSGTVHLQDVRVPKTHLVPGYKGYEQPTADGAIFQIIQAAVDTGIAQAALDDTVRFVRGHSRPWVDSGLDDASQDPYTLQRVGDLSVRLHATEAFLNGVNPPLHAWS